MSFSLEENDYHDALLKSVDVDYRAGKIVLRVDAYEKSNGGRRSGVALEFGNVSSFNAISNLKDISSAGSFGNVNYIRSSGDGRTYIYLSNGAFEISSDSVEVTPEVV